MGDDNRPCPELPTVGQAQSGHPAIDHDQFVGFAFDDRETYGLANGSLHRGGVELPIGLGARSANCRTLAAVKNAELDAAGIRNPAHQTVERIDLANQMALAETANGGIAGHGADGREPMRHQSRRRAHPGRRSRSLTAGVAAADHDDVEVRSLCTHGGLLAQSGKSRK
ncbi:hypothetical protein ACVWXO_002463 [Bradyrhizobium sp. LM2.7]